MEIPMLSFCGWPGAGKTTLLEKLIPVLRAQGLRLALLKSDGHDFQMDKPGKDSWRFTQAGAELTVLSNGSHAAFLENRPLDLAALRARIRDVDLILGEGWHGADIPLIEVRGDEKAPLRCARPERLLALTGPGAAPPGLPHFAREDTAGIAGFILAWLASAPTEPFALGSVRERRCSGVRKGWAKDRTET